jgi:hypothetical protein
MLKHPTGGTIVLEELERCAQLVKHTNLMQVGISDKQPVLYERIPDMEYFDLMKFGGWEQ